MITMPDNENFYNYCTLHFGKIVLGYSSSLIQEYVTGIDCLNNRRAHYKWTRNRLWIIQKGICYWCGKQCVKDGLGGDRDQFTVDHVIPLGASGTNHWKNMIGSCFSCNNTRNKKWEYVRLIKWENKEIENECYTII